MDKWSLKVLTKIYNKGFYNHLEHLLNNEAMTICCDNIGYNHVISLHVHNSLGRFHNRATHIHHVGITHINQPISMALIRPDTDRVTLSGEHYTHANIIPTLTK